MNTPKFSVALIARNEALTLPRMIGSLKEFQERGGEIWVLDTGSTDNTIEVAEGLGCKVEAVGDKFRINIDEELANKINSKFVVEGEEPVVKAGDSLFDFASARNYIADFPINDMIATPDCDEIFTKFDIDKLDEVIAGGAEQLEYEFVFSHDHLGNPVIKFRHCKFYNLKKLKWHGIIHEVLGGAAHQVYLGEDIIKLEHYQNEKTNRSGYLKGLAVDCFNHPDNDRNSHYLAREMFYLGRYKSAIKEFENHISMGRWGTEASQSMLFIGDCYKYLGDTNNMLLWYIKSIEKEARREPLMRLAEYYFGKNAYYQVIVFCEAALSITQLPFYSNHQPYYENVPHELLYIAYWWVGNIAKSKEHWLKALSYCPHNPRYISDGKFYRDSDKLDEYTKNIKENKNFTFVKRGDGELACMAGEVGANCDGHPYSQELGDRLKESFEFLKDKADIVEWDDQANYNILLHRKDNDLEKLKKFWMAIKNSPRRKMFIGPSRLEEVSSLLGSNFIEVSPTNAFESIKEFLNYLVDSPINNTIFVFSCGMPAKYFIAELLKLNPNITCIDAGSSFDPIFVGNTRTEQASQEELIDLYFNHYDDPGIEGMMTHNELDWLYRTSKTVDSFLEIGSFKGKSTHAILSGGAEIVYAVDHFVGSSDPIETGNEDTFADFIDNVGHFSNLRVYQMSSLEAVNSFEDKSLDVVFIDGGHKIQEITEDIVAWLPKAKKILCGHDYHDTKAVRLAVDALLGPVNVYDRIWWKVLDGTEVLDMEKANKLARYLDTEFVAKMFALPQENHPEKLFVEPYIVGEIVCDLGCGRNKTIEKAIGFDIEPVTDVQSSIDSLPSVETESVDTIISRHSIEHLADCEGALREWRRILKPSGRMILVVPDDEAINTLDPMISDGQHKQAFTRDSLVKLIESIPGLVVTGMTDVVPGWSFGLIVEKEAFTTPKVTFVIPTLGREEGLKRCLDSIDALNYPKEQIEVIIKQDSFENRTGVPKLVKQGVEESTGEWIVFASNDTEFTPDSILEALWEGDAGYVAFNTGEVSPDEGNINEHFMIRKDIIEKIGEVFDTDFWHAGCDNLLLAKMRKLGVFKRAPRAVIKHYHFTKGAEMDKTYTLGWSKVEEDRALLAKKLKELETN